jgi:excisionase family DNA binding protein
MHEAELGPTSGKALPDGFLSRQAAAARLGISLKTLDRWIIQKKLEAHLWQNRVVLREEVVQAWCTPRPYRRRTRAPHPQQQRTAVVSPVVQGANPVERGPAG